MELLALSFLPSVDSLLSTLIVIVGLGLVIFFHELGHFAVAKWCDVNVERFSIGFGPILWRRRWGETEYALSVIPFGGYVKMLGQDDIDPSQLTSEEIAEDPRSYTAKSVGQRMAIISAGVIMNVITGLLFFMVAFRSGVETTPALVGAVQVAMPAWQAGLHTGDRITRINGREVSDFSDIMRGTALSTGTVRVEGVRPDGTRFDETLVPDQSGTRRRIGVAQAQGLEIYKPRSPKGIPFVVPGTPAAQATPGFQPGDLVTAVNGERVSDFVELERQLADHRDESLTLTVDREPSVDITVPPAPFRTLGMTTDIGDIIAIQDKSPAADAGLKVGDRLVAVDGRDIGKEIDPLRLPDYFARRHGQSVEVLVTRAEEDGRRDQITLTVVPEDRPGWIEAPDFENTPASVPAMGLAYRIVPTVLSVEPGGPADQAGIKDNEIITQMELILPDGGPPDGLASRSVTIDIGETNWAYAFWQMQQYPNREVRLTVKDVDSQQTRKVAMTPRPADDWYQPTARGLRFFSLSVPQEAENASQALVMAWQHTRNSLMDVYLTLRSLITRQLSIKELHGPLGIVKVAHDVASVGIAPFLLFLGFLSVNLAVLNFLPIPVLDGGHMVFLLWEAIARRRPSERVLVAATYAGMIFVLTLMCLVVYLDISRFYNGE